MPEPDLPAILVVDDEEALLKSVRRTLRAAGFEEVLVCADPRNVMPLLGAGPVSLILLDLIMPNIGGRELLAAISAGYPAIPVVVVTAEQDARIAVECMKNGAYDYLLKPVHPDELVAVVSRALDIASSATRTSGSARSCSATNSNGPTRSNRF